LTGTDDEPPHRRSRATIQGAHQSRAPFGGRPHAARPPTLQLDRTTRYGASLQPLSRRTVSAHRRSRIAENTGFSSLSEACRCAPMCTSHAPSMAAITRSTTASTSARTTASGYGAARRPEPRARSCDSLGRTTGTGFRRPDGEARRSHAARRRRNRRRPLPQGGHQAPGRTRGSFRLGTTTTGPRGEAANRIHRAGSPRVGPGFGPGRAGGSPTGGDLPGPTEREPRMRPGRR